MPYQNFAGWLGTSSVFMTVTALLWRNNPINWEQSQLNIPLAVYLSNFGFATVMSLTSGFFVPVLLGLLLGVTPAVLLWLKGSSIPVQVPTEQPEISVAIIAVK
jgi:putative membrane protein